MRKILSFLLMALFSVGMWAADTYYYRGSQNGWKASEMTESTDGFYAYFAAKGYANNGNENNNFKVSKTADSWDYNNGYATRGFNGTDVKNESGDKSIGLNWDGDNICVYCTVDFYILVYYPNTIINNTSKPVVCASTTLPEGALYLAGDGWCGAEWNTTDEANKMTWNKAKGTFTKTINGVSAADHKFKVSTYSWGTAYGHEAYDAASSKNVVSCSADDGNVKFQPAMEGTVTVTIDAATQKISVVCQTPVVTFDKEGGDKGSASVEAEYGVAATAITIPEKANYDFKGYYTEDNGTGTAVINADGSWKSSVENYTDKDGKWIARANSTLYAKWEGKNYAITYKDENNAAYSGSNSEALPSSYQYGAGVTLVNGIKADHQFLGWYDNATCTGEAVTAIAADATGAKTFYAKWKEIDGGSVTLLAGEGGEVSADKSVWGANAMIADIKANSDVAIYARPNTGYSFDQWTKVSGEGAIKTNAATGEFSAVAYQNASVSASFSENKVAIEPTVHFDAGTAAYTAEASVAAIGIATSSVLTASAATEGFAFAGWTLSSNLVVVSGNAAKDLSITVRTNGDGDAVSAVANYNEDLSTPFVLNGGAAFGETAWKQALPLKKKSGHSTEKIAYITISNLAPVGEADNAAYYFKIVDDENKWYGLPAEGESYWFLRTTEEQTLADAKNIQLRADKAGNYEIKVDYSTAALKISIAFPEQVSSDVTVTAPEHGTITVKDGEAAIGAKVQEGTVLTVTAAPKDATAYHIYNLRAYKTGEPATTVEIKNGQLTMPAYPITIIADEKAIVLKDLLFVPGVWAEEKAKIAAWIWTRKEGHAMADQWTAFFAPKSAGNDTLSVKLDADADSIVFVRFNSTAEAPSWDDKEDFRWNSLAGDTIDKIGLTYTITDWYEGTWDPYIPAKYYLTGDSALVVDAGLDKAKAWNPSAIKVTENTYVFAGLKKGHEYQLKATIDGQWESAKTYKDLTEKALGLKTDGADNIIFKMANDGDVTVTLTDKVFTVEGDFAMPTVAIAGNVTGWSPVEMELAENKLSASVTLKNLEFGLDSFKIVLDGNWISKNGEGESFYTFHRDWNEDKDIKGGNRNMILDRDNAGDYTFTWVFANDSLHIAFPAAPDTATIYFVNTNKDWTDKIYAHAFVGEKGYQTWPGVEMTNTGEKVWEKAIYSAKVPVTYSSVIFNNGEAQTATYAWTKDKPYFCDGTWYADQASIPEIEPAKYYITGNAALVAYAGLAEESAWNEKAIKVIKDTFVFENLAAGYYLMKVVTKDAEPNWIGYDRLTEKSKGLLDAEDHQIGFTMEQAGNVTVVYKEGVFVVKGDYAKLPKVGLAANFISWNWAENLLVPAEDSLSASLKVNLGVTDTIRFKMVSDGNWLSLNGEGESEYGIHRTWPSAAHVNIVDGRNFALTTDKEGEYTFTWTYADSTITVKFPELVSYDVTVTAPTNGTITVKNGEDAISAPVQEGTVLTVTAAANDPAEYEIKNLRAYKTDDEGTEVEIKDGKLIMPAYPITITADEEKIVYQTLYFVDKDGWNGVNAYVFVDEHAVYKIWPGEAMTKEERKVKEKDLYSYTFPAKYTKIIFNKKDQAETKTADMLWNAATPYYCNGFWYESEEAVVLDANAKYYITGDNAIMGAWDPAAIKVAEDSYTFSNLPAGTYGMKITLEGTWEEGKVKGYSDLTVQDPSFDTNSDNDIIFKLNEPSDVTVTYNATTFTVTGKFAQREYYIAGTFTNWKDNMVKMTEKDGNYATNIEIADITEAPLFKVVYVHGTDSVWYGLKSYSAMTSDDCSNWEIGGGEANIGIKPTKAGQYSFYFNPNGLFLTVEMPSQGGGTALDNIRATEKAQKVILNGQLLILYNERMYNIQGQTVK